ncbi:MAG: DUF1835 domain-containing protein [Bacteroidia bacterium]|nr:DUF1835 domain-containing protein [Bacteroidia bacterium]MBT8269659.1 DUF1835 domain-containing protein [Bacteroidia bacterium]NNF81409.1 DUF1835 domain-containing protein [Flavobacteriaceae bacterium]NNK70492.1 DUF1835 domain-containing protein [Flavobacteriaceae bacterium]NNL80720.1 DUF1835 domain-containing protein [Flavobacteriaceae bacterium]
MAKKVLHITNGSSLTEYLHELDFKGDFLTWQEALCEGPTIDKIDSERFFKLRTEFLRSTYDVDVNEEERRSELGKLDNIDSYSEINLWFEYDLFCHINLLGVLNLIFQKKIDLPLFLICSGRVPGEKEMKGLSELTSNQLIKHYNDRVILTEEDKEYADSIWRIYCGHDHNLLKPFIVQTSSFPYMASCLSAHMKRFPDSKSGLSAIEHNILRLVRDNKINSKHHLLGYAMNYQGYYGYGDIQLERIIDNLSPFFIFETDNIKLHRDGHEALMGHHNFAAEIQNDIVYGGVKRLEFQFSKIKNKLIKTVINAY